MTTVAARLAVWRSRVDYQGLILGLVCAIITALLMLGRQYTHEPIQQRLAEDREALLSEVLSTHQYDNQPLNDVIVVHDTLLSDEPVTVYLVKYQNVLSAMVFQVKSPGYGGPITLMLAIDTLGKIVGVRTLSHKETPGLADKIDIDKSEWITRFNGHSLSTTGRQMWAVKKDGGMFDQFTGATITPRAVVQGVLAGLDFHLRQRRHIFDGQSQYTQQDNEHESR